MKDTRRPNGGAAPPPKQPAGSEAVAAFEEAYLRYAPRLHKIAIRKFGIDPGNAAGLVQAVFATYLQHAADVERLEPYLIGAICNASRNHLRPSSTLNAPSCGEQPCAATPDEAWLDE